VNRCLQFKILIALSFCCLLCACESTTQPQSNLSTIQMKVGSKTYTLEVADTDDARTRGLMRRDSMPADHGMIFVFKEPQKMAFWMKNTRIPLDIVYIDANAKVDSVKQMQPYVETGIWSEGPIQWAIELNQGQGKEAGVKAGDALEIPMGARAAKE
jgi:uncharacterized membrane protein (UPF0127 family)